MIKTSEKYILEDIKPYSIIVVPCNTSGKDDSKLGSIVRKQFPAAYERYYSRCKDFELSHKENEILGSFASTQISRELIICHAIDEFKHEQHFKFSWKALENIVKKLERQLYMMN